MSELRRVGTGALLATVAFVVVLGAGPLRAETIAAGYALVLAALALASLTRVLNDARRRSPSRFEQELRREKLAPTRPPELVRVEREIVLASSNAGHLHTRLRPLLRDIAAARLDFDLGRKPATARARLGDEAWELLRPDAPVPADRAAPGLSLRRLRAIVDRLEQL